MGLSSPPEPPAAPPRPPVSEATAPVAFASVAPSGLALPGVACSRPPALATAPPRPCNTPLSPAVFPGSDPPRLVTVPPRLVSRPATGAPSRVVSPTCWVSPVTVPASGLTLGSRAAPTPARVGCKPSGSTLSTVLPTLPSAGASSGVDGPPSTPPVTPATTCVTGFSSPPWPDRPAVNAPTAPVALPSTVVSGLGLFASACSRPPVLATVLPKPSTRPPTPGLSPPGKPAPSSVEPRLLTSPPTCLTAPSTGWPRPVVAPISCVRPTTVSATGLIVGSSALPTPPSVASRFKGRVLSTAPPVLPRVVSSRPAVTGLVGLVGSVPPGFVPPPPGLRPPPPGFVGMSVPGKLADLLPPPPPPQAARALIRAAAKAVEVKMREMRRASVLVCMANSLCWKSQAEKRPDTSTHAQSVPTLFK
ncbi:hypothetical protein AGI3411_05890 [Achromobacter agilis]|uniref:Uncharacterized protein n=1 Tax=Achromobacter agilis TaxID=1353888 RepID=A0A446CZ66_9BURK|nr:hypothetical protein AGI3411_05890 [Achromobacter agilis]